MLCPVLFTLADVTVDPELIKNRRAGVAARIVSEADVHARRQRAAPERGGERGDPVVGDLVLVRSSSALPRERCGTET